METNMNFRVDYPLSLTIDECLQLLEKETAESERQLKERQIDIAMRLKLNDTVLIPTDTIIEIANALMTVTKIKLYGPESLLNKANRISREDYYLLKERRA